jgi:hypothetical protein
VRIELPSTFVHDVAWSPDGRQLVVVHGPPTGRTAWLLDRRGQRLFDFGGNNVSRSLASFARSGERLLLAGLYGSDNVLELWQLGGAAPTRVHSQAVGSLAICALLDPPGTRILVAGTDRFPSQNGYRVLTDTGAVVAEHAVRTLQGCLPLLLSGTPAAAASAPSAGASAGTATDAGGAPAAEGRDELDKRLKAVTKKLKSLEPLKEKQRLGIVLEDNQRTKLASEAAWLDEVAALTAELARVH